MYRNPPRTANFGILLPSPGQNFDAGKQTTLAQAMNTQAMADATKARTDQTEARRLAGLAAGGDKQAVGALMQYDHAAATKIDAYLSTKDERTRTNAYKEAQLVNSILGSATPEDYRYRRQMLIDKGASLGMKIDASKLPEVYDQNALAPVLQGASVLSQHYNATQANKPMTTGQLATIIGPDGKPQYVSARDAVGKSPWSQPKPAKPRATAKDQNGVARYIDTREAVFPGVSKEPKATKPIPAAALKMQQGHLDAIGTSAAIQADLTGIMKTIDQGNLKLSGGGNLMNEAMNYAGASSEESRNYSTFMSTLEKLRNDSLRLNNGVQTDGDAQRAWNELFSNVTDTTLVRQRLGEIVNINERAVQLRKLQVDTIRNNYNAGPFDFGGFENVDAAIGPGQGQGQSRTLAPELQEIMKTVTPEDVQAEIRRRQLERQQQAGYVG